MVGIGEYSIRNIIGNRNSDPGHWLLRGIQSAIFYYASCAPCVERAHKKKRRREAELAAKEMVDREPNFNRQPMAFQTNEQWTEEILIGPGPPKQYKGDPIAQKYQQEVKRLIRTPPATPNEEQQKKKSMLKQRPKVERRLSDAMLNVKESIIESLHPGRWVLRRQDRDDEILWWGLGDNVTNVKEKVKGMWDKVTHTKDEDVRTGRKRAHTNESDRPDWHRGLNAPVNDLHPPVVSMLPATREEAAWMVLPPPSAAVMAGRERPGPEMAYRKAMCVIGAPEREQENVRPTESPRSMSDMTWATDSAGDTSDEEEEIRPRHSSEPLPRVRPPARAAYTDLSVPRVRPIKTLDGIPMDLFTKAELPSKGTDTPKSRPTSWSFQYIIPNQHATQ